MELARHPLKKKKTNFILTERSTDVSQTKNEEKNTPGRRNNSFRVSLEEEKNLICNGK